MNPDKDIRAVVRLDIPENLAAGLSSGPFAEASNPILYPAMFKLKFLIFSRTLSINTIHAKNVINVLLDICSYFL